MCAGHGRGSVRATYSSTYGGLVLRGSVTDFRNVLAVLNAEKQEQLRKVQKPPTPRCGFDVFGAFSSLLRCSSDHDERVGFVDVGAGGRAVGDDGAAVLDVRVGRRAVGDDGAAVLDVRVDRRAVGDDGVAVLDVRVGGLVDAVPGALATADAAGCVAVPKGTGRRCCGRTW